MAATKTTKRPVRRGASGRGSARPTRRTRRSATRPVIGFIGAGNMARSLAAGLVNSGWPRDRLLLSDPDAGQRQAVARALKVRALADNLEVAARADTVVFAVKPQVLKAVAQSLASVAQHKHPLVISIAAGVRIDDIQRWLGGGLPIVRAMPNTAALIGSGATGLYANSTTDAGMREQAEAVLRAVGVTAWVPTEDLLDVVTALSGSGPAYFFLVMEALERAAIEQGLDPLQARLLTIETAYGAAKMALEGGEEPASLRARVTSPGGTTERAIAALQQGGLEKLFRNALIEATQRARELARMLSS